MKKKLLSEIIAVTMAFGVVCPSMSVSADPVISNELKESQAKYEALQGKINSLNEKVQELDSQLSNLSININDNNKKIEDIEKEVENKNKEIEQVKKDIEEKEKVLGKRLREMYKSGGISNYISLIFSANSLSDLIMKLDSANRLVKIDKGIVKDLRSGKADLDEKVSTLDTKAKDIEKLNDDIKVQAKELSTKKAEQEVVVNEAKAEKEAFDKEFLEPAEMDFIKSELESLKGNSISSLSGAIKRAEGILKQLKSENSKNKLSESINFAKSNLAQLEQQQAQAQNNNSNNSSSSNNNGSNKTDRNNTSASATGNAIVDYACGFIGTPYVFGAEGPGTFDCSGFTSYVYRHVVGRDISRTTYTQVNQGVAVSRDQLQPGDLVFTSPHHVGICVGNGKMIHAPQTGDSVKISNIWSFYAARRIL